MKNEPKQICIHKSSWKDWGSRTDWEGIDEIRDYHMTPKGQTWVSKDGFRKPGRGFKDVAYHYLIQKDGTIQKGRTEEIRPASAYGHNRDVLAICLIGEFIIEHPTAEQIHSLTALVYDACRRYDIATDMHHIFGHCDYRDPPGKRDCPGKNLHRMIPIVAKHVDRMLKERGE